MISDTTGVVPVMPTLLSIGREGGITGHTRNYEKVARDMAGVYRDKTAWHTQLTTAGADRVVYRVEDHRYNEEPGSLIVGTSTLLPGLVGEEFALTRGHLHAIADRAELYYCLSGRGVMLLETVDGMSQAHELTPGKAINVPGHWIHRSINTGTEPFVTLFCYQANAGQNYQIIEKAGGMKSLILTDHQGGWKSVPNPEHRGYQL